MSNIATTLMSAFLTVSVLTLGACTNNNSPETLTVDLNETAAKAPSTPTDELQALEKVVGKKGDKRELVSDVIAILEAQNLDRQSKFADSVGAWQKAMLLARGKFGKIAFEGWVAAYSNNLAKKVDRNVLAKLLLAESKSGSISIFMSDKKIITEDAILPYVEQHATKWLLETEMPSNPDYDAPTIKTIPLDDPLLSSAANSYCKGDKKQKESWTGWAGNLPPSVQHYWIGLTSHCRARKLGAIDAYKKALELFGTDKIFRAMAIETAQNLAVIQRRSGGRVEAANVYTELMNLWDAGGVTRESFGEENYDFYLRKINDTLWAARYRGLIGDHENAKIYAQKALDFIGVAFAAPSNEMEKFHKELTILKAEAYHVLSFRIALEKGEFETAQSLSLLALEIPNLDDEWKDRFSWFAGFYDYLSGNFASAKERWQKLEGETKDDSTRPMLYFWLAKAHDRLGQKAESDNFLEALTVDYPLSYYSVVAPKKSNLSAENDWRKVFGNINELKESLSEGRDFNLRKVREDSEMGQLLTRSEILIEAHLNTWADSALQDFRSAFSNRYILENHVPEYVYLSRLYYKNQNYLQSIALTTMLMNDTPRFWQSYPEQLLIYFPKPYQPEYKRAALEHRLEEELLLAVSRQESGFTPNIKSWAGAYGLMQITVPTAIKLLEGKVTDYDEIVNTLKDPERNIELGADYLHQLKRRYQGFNAGIYGGYNAGEYAMDAWLKRRAHSDPTVFIEMIPFGETKGYIKNVWRNLWVYHHLRGHIAKTH